MVNFSQFSVYSAVVKESLAVSTGNCESNNCYSLITVCVCVYVCACVCVCVWVFVYARVWDERTGCNVSDVYIHIDLECL